MNNPLHFRSYFKFLGRNTLYTAINILGLSVSLMFVILIAVYTRQEISTDKFHEKGDRIYALGSENQIASGYGMMGPLLMSRYPEIENTTAYTNNNVAATVDGRKLMVDITMVDSTFLDIFSFRMIEGDGRAALRTTTDALVSQSFARKVFGSESPIGKSIVFDDDLTVVVAGIIEDFKNSVITETDVVMNAANASNFNGSISNENLSNAAGVIQFLLTYPGTDLPSKTDDMVQFFKSFYWPYINDAYKEVTLTRLPDIYFSKLYASGNFSANQGDESLVKILISVGLLILLFALINYINLTVAQTGFRAKEMATRRLLGASRGEIFAKFILESILMCALAFVIGLLLAGAFEGTFGNLLDRELDVFRSIDATTGVIYAGVVVLLGAISGVIPAVFISRYTPINVVRGSFAHKSKMVFSKIFIVFQNVITIVLIGSALTMLLQIKYMINEPMGYNIDKILYIPTIGLDNMDKITTFRNEISNLASVERVSLSRGTPLDGGNNNSSVYYGRNISLQVIEADTAFMDMMGFEIYKDCNQPGNWINQAYASMLIMDKDSTAFKWDTGENEQMLPIRGIIKNFRLYNGFADETKPVSIVIYRNRPLWPWNILVKVRGDEAQTYHDIEAIFRNITGMDMQRAKYMDEMLVESFSAQQRVYKTVLLFTIIAVIISMLGLLAMSTYFIQQRASEIAIRKVFGSTREEVFRRLVFNFIRLVVIAFAISVPIIWYVMRWWLSNYAHRIGLNPLIFIAAGLAALLIAAVSVSWQSARVANMNPVDSIKN